MTQTTSLAVEDVWGGMGLTDDAVKYNNDYANTVFDKYTNYSDNKTPDYSQGNTQQIYLLRQLQIISLTKKKELLKK